MGSYKVHIKSIVNLFPTVIAKLLQPRRSALYCSERSPDATLQYKAERLGWSGSLLLQTEAALICDYSRKQTDYRCVLYMTPLKKKVGSYKVWDTQTFDSWGSAVAAATFLLQETTKNTFRNEHCTYRLPVFPDFLLTNIAFSIIPMYVFGERFEQLV